MAAWRLVRRRYVPHGETVAKGLRERERRAGVAGFRGLSVRSVLARGRGASREVRAQLLRHDLRVRAAAGAGREDGGLAREGWSLQERQGRAHAPELPAVCYLLFRHR